MRIPLISFSVLFLLFSTLVFPQGQEQKEKKMPKDELEELMNSAIPFAQKMLKEHGEFFPYGEAIDSHGKIVAVGAHDGREQPPSTELIRLLTDGLRAGAKSGEYKATAIVYDVRIIPPGSNEKSDAIAINLDHRDGLSIITFLPYKISGKDVIYGEMFAQKGEAKIFQR